MFNLPILVIFIDDRAIKYFITNNALYFLLIQKTIGKAGLGPSTIMIHKMSYIMWWYNMISFLSIIMPNIKEVFLCYSGEECGPRCESTPGIPSYCANV